jgi:hypothetical protein
MQTARTRRLAEGLAEADGSGSAEAAAAIMSCKTLTDLFMLEYSLLIPDERMGLVDAVLPGGNRWVS